MGSGGHWGQHGLEELGWVAWGRYPCMSPQVSELPFPFERHQQFEQSMRTPVGPNWNTQRAFQKLTAPRVITRAGHIIQPISAEDVPDTAPGSGARLGGEAMPRRKAVSGGKAVSRGKAGSRGKAVPGEKAQQPRHHRAQ